MATPLAVALDPDLQRGLDGVSSDNSDGSDNDVETEETAAPAPRPRARPRGAPPPEPVPPPPAFISPLGGYPPATTHWGVQKRNGVGEWEIKAWAPPGAPVEVREWLLSELTYDTLYDRWGPGVYEIRWIQAMPRGGMRNLRGGREVTVRPREPATPPAPSQSVAPRARNLLEGQVGEAFEMISMIERMAGSKMSETMQVAAAMVQMSGAGNRGGISGEDLRAILREEREAHTRELQALEARTTAAIAALREEDGEDDEPAGAGVADAAASLLPTIKGKGWWADIARYLAAHPAVAQTAIEKGLPVVANLGVELIGLVKSASPPPPPPAPRPVAMPRQTIAPPPPPVVESVPVPAPPGPTGPTFSEVTSLSAWK